MQEPGGPSASSMDWQLVPHGTLKSKPNIKPPKAAKSGARSNGRQHRVSKAKKTPTRGKPTTANKEGRSSASTPAALDPSVTDVESVKKRRITPQVTTPMSLDPRTTVSAQLKEAENAARAGALTGGRVTRKRKY